MIIKSPDKLSPVNNSIYFEFLSPLYVNDNFKYVYKILWKYENFSTNIFNESDIYKVIPRISGNAYANLSSFLKSVILSDINPFCTGVNNTDKSLIEYVINCGYEYDIDINATTFNYTTTGNLGLIISPSNPLVAGDIIYISNVTNNININYTGYSTVIYHTPSYIVVNKPYGANIPGESVKIKRLMRFSETSQRLYTYNGTRQYLENNTDFTNIHLWQPTNFNGKYLLNTYWKYTNKPKLIKPNEYETINIIIESPSNNWFFEFNGYDFNGNQIYNYTNVPLNVNSNNYNFLTVGIGTQNIIDLLGNPNFFDNVDYYEIFVRCKLLKSQPFIFKIDRKCYIYNPVRLCFLNRWGGYDYFTFNLESKKYINIDRKKYVKPLDVYYKIGDRGDSIFNVYANEEITVNSDYIDEDIALWLSELLTSPDVYIIDGNNKIPVIVTDTNYTYKTKLREKLINITVNLKLSQNIIIQNG